MRSFIIFLILFPVYSLSMATIIHVPSDSATIQGGVNGASVNDTVLVSNGTYTEHISIDKSISLIGESATGAIIDGSGTGSIILVMANRVTIKKFTLTNAGSNQPYEMGWDAAVRLIAADSCLVEHCRIHANGAAGITVGSSSYNDFRKCIIHDNPVGLYFHENEPPGPYYNNTENRILKNQITGNSTKGILFEHALIFHQSNFIQGNLISDNQEGISMIMADGNEISYNNFMSNTGYGVYLSQCMGGGYNNEIHHNCFMMNNGGATQGCNFSSLGQNYWNSQFESEGNYWSDYTGSDNNGDGIGDEPYAIDGDGETFDLYPLMYLQDSDGDYIINYVDNCPNTYNPDQADLDVNAVGDVCEDYLPGNANADDNVDVADAVFLINFVFREGSPPPYPNWADANADCTINIGDSVYLINFIFREGSAPLPGCVE